MSTASASHSASVEERDRRRLAAYMSLATAFAYPDEALFTAFEIIAEKDRASLQGEYDRLFRAGSLWLEGAEHVIKNEFQRATHLADIMGFYRAFGVEPDLERPDALTCELEFMHVLVAKKLRARSGLSGDAGEEKARVCEEAEKKFLHEYLAPAALAIGTKILARSEHPFYTEAARELVEFMNEEAPDVTTPESAPFFTCAEGIPDEEADCVCN